MHTQLLVLGAGPGGYAAAFLAADKGLQVTLVDADPRLGGTCLLRGCIPSKALLHVAKVMHEAGGLREWGIDFPAPAVNIDLLRTRKEKVLNTLANGLKQLAKQRKVNVVTGRGRFVNSSTLAVDRIAEPFTFDHCILATGSTPAKIPAFDLNSPRVMDSAAALDLPDVPASLLVLGGGYIGLELGTVFATLGSKVTVIELTEGLLPGVDRDLVKPLSGRLEKLFAAIRLETKVLRLEDRGEGIDVTSAGAGGERTERFERVLVSVGRKPCTAEIGLEKTQVRLDQRGFVIVDAQRRTADPHILAIGDVAGEPMLAHKATHEAKVAVEALAGEPASFDPVAIPAVVFTDPEIAWAGLTEGQAKEQGRQVAVARFPWAASGKAQSLGRTEGMTKILYDGETERVLGLGIVGASAGDLIAECVLALEMGCTLRDVAETIHPHPTLGETVGMAAEMPLGLATEIYRPKRNTP
ncbi:MAG: dihydrolipoyl dehydrogenase [Planctomycetia bacterium]|nr:dihydrolipoyl dehydrogenase [Planctomycetia bacterium]